MPDYTLAPVDVQRTPGALDELFAHIKRDFSLPEIIPYARQQKAFAAGALHLVYLTRGGTRYGYMVYAHWPDLGVLHVVYLAIFPQSRGAGLGSIFMQLVCALYPGRTVLLEVEDPRAAKTEEEKQLQQRRIAFYERLGLRLVPLQSVRLYGKRECLMASADIPHANWPWLLRELYARMRPPGTRWLAGIVLRLMVLVKI